MPPSGYDAPMVGLPPSSRASALDALVRPLVTLGRRWTTRIIVLPRAPLVATGPYRFVSHPNYLVVIGEIAVLPLCLGMPWYALAFSLANAAVLAIRSRSSIMAILAMGGVGYGVALLFGLLGAPDLALTQVLIETLTLVLLAFLVRPQ